MTTKAIKSLKVGDTVRSTDDGSTGTVIEINWCAVKIEWQDGAFGVFRFDEHADRIEKA